MYYYKVAMIG